MINIQKRFLLFIFRCIATRLILTFYVKNLDKKYNNCYIFFNTPNWIIINLFF